MDAQDLTDLYYAHARDVLGFFMRRTGDPQIALDLLGETFLAALERRHGCRAKHDRERTTWLYRIAASKLVDHYRRSASERRTAERFAGELRAPSEDELATIRHLTGPSGRDEQVRAAFEALSEEQREAVRLRVLDEHPYPRVSRELGISEPAARARVSRALRTLRRAIASEREAEQ
jgi:RNA polymerase sigma-70 factor (ECF subfamily)